MHADHVTGTGFLKQLLPGSKSVISKASGALADQYLEHSDIVEFGRHRIRVAATPGHTSGCMTFIVDEQASRLAIVLYALRGNDDDEEEEDSF